jgi:hypothetical protein
MKRGCELPKGNLSNARLRHCLIGPKKDSIEHSLKIAVSEKNIENKKINP